MCACVCVQNCTSSELRWNCISSVSLQLVRKWLKRECETKYSKRTLEHAIFFLKKKEQKRKKCSRKWNRIRCAKSEWEKNNRNAQLVWQLSGHGWLGPSWKAHKLLGKCVHQAPIFLTVLYLEDRNRRFRFGSYVLFHIFIIIILINFNAFEHLKLPKCVCIHIRMNIDEEQHPRKKPATETHKKVARAQRAFGKLFKSRLVIFSFLRAMNDTGRKRWACIRQNGSLSRFVCREIHSQIYEVVGIRKHLGFTALH